MEPEVTRDIILAICDLGNVMEYSKDEFNYWTERLTVVEDWVDNGFVKHDVTCYYSIVYDTVTNTYYRVDFHSSYSYGLGEHLISITTCVPVEVVTTTYVSHTKSELK